MLIPPDRFPSGSPSENQCDARPAFFAGRSFLTSFIKGYFVLAYTNQYPYPASDQSSIRQS